MKNFAYSWIIYDENHGQSQDKFGRRFNELINPKIIAENESSAMKIALEQYEEAIIEGMINEDFEIELIELIEDDEGEFIEDEE